MCKWLPEPDVGFLVQMKNFELEPGLKKERARDVLAVGLIYVVTEYKR